MLSPNSVQSRAGKYVTFQIARRYFAIEAARIRNVMPASAIADLPRTIEAVRGIVRVGGRVTPVIDVRARLDLPPRSTGRRSAVIVVALDDAPNAACIGLIVDKLTEVLDVHDRDIRGNVVQLRSGGRPYGRPKLLLEVSSLIPTAEQARLKSALENLGLLW